MNRSVSVPGAAVRFWKRHCQVLGRENILIRLFPLNWEVTIWTIWIYQSRTWLCQSHTQQKCSHFDFRKPHKEFTKDMSTVEQTSTKSRKCSSSSPHLQRLLWGEILSVAKAPAAPGSDMNWELNPAGQTDPLAHPPAALWQLFWWGESRVPPPAGPAESNWWSRKLLLWFCLHLLSLKAALLSLWPGKIRIKNKNVFICYYHHYGKVFLFNF